jgi:TonB family protein
LKGAGSGFMKAKRFLIIVILLLMRTAEAQSTKDPSLQRVQSSEQAAMQYLISVVEPKYPDDVHVSGKVVVKIVIDKEGHVSEAKMVSGHPMLVGTTIDAVKQWKFYPYALEKGEPVEVETTATVEFRADPPHVVTPKPPRVPRLRISRSVADGLSLRKVEPIYPLEAKIKQIQGDVILMVVVDERGKVAETRVVSGHPVLAEAAMNAVKQWKYKPYTLNGDPVEFETSVKMQFHL